MSEGISEFHRFEAEQLLRLIYREHITQLATFGWNHNRIIEIVPYDETVHEKVSEWLQHFEQGILARHKL